MDKIKNTVNIFKNLCYKYDSTWITRNRKLNTYNLFCYLSNSLINQKTFNETILDFKYSENISYNNLSSSALTKARKKMLYFEDLHKNLINKFYNNTRNNVYAIDGSKIRLFPSACKNNFKTRDSKSKSLLGMISGIYDINNNIIKDINITSHFNERFRCCEKYWSKTFCRTK